LSECNLTEIQILPWLRQGPFLAGAERLIQAEMCGFYGLAGVSVLPDVSGWSPCIMNEQCATAFPGERRSIAVAFAGLFLVFGRDPCLSGRFRLATQPPIPAQKIPA
jgi:hypothetical protein